MRALIIDDVRLARAELQRLLQAHPEVEVVGEASNVPDGVQLIEQTKPDLVFLDIQMPGGSGFDLLAALDQAPAVIFTTAYDQYAIRAFDVNALDYLLKPVEPARLAQALEKCDRQMQQPEERPLERPQTADGKVFIKDGERCWFVALEQIALFESEGNYTRVHFDQYAPLMLRSLTQLEARLDPAKFMRISRSQIVNLEFVTGIAPAPSGGLTLTLKGELKVGMSRRRAADFKQLNRL
jgi:two-component system LytT family response regulator